jgi:CO/xanthine dehydrogenase Mo-binding subunit
VINPQGAEGQVEGGTAIGLGWALTEALVLDRGLVRNPSFTDYHLPTALDVPPIDTVFVEEPEPGGPYGAKGIGELAAVVAAPAIAAAVRAATGRALNRLPLTPEDVTGLRAPARPRARPPVPDVPAQTAVPEATGLVPGQQELMKAR